MAPTADWASAPVQAPHRCGSRDRGRLEATGCPSMSAPISPSRSGRSSSGSSATPSRRGSTSPASACPRCARWRPRCGSTPTPSAPSTRGCRRRAGWSRAARSAPSSPIRCPAPTTTRSRRSSTARSTRRRARASSPTSSRPGPSRAPPSAPSVGARRLLFVECGQSETEPFVSQLRSAFGDRVELVEGTTIPLLEQRLAQGGIDAVVTTAHHAEEVRATRHGDPGRQPAAVAGVHGRRRRGRGAAAWRARRGCRTRAGCRAGTRLRCCAGSRRAPP